MVFSAVTVVFALVLAGCGGNTHRIPEATPEMAGALGVETGQLVRGRELYLKHCAQCHDRVTPGFMEPEYWRGILPHMAEHAKLDPARETELLLYLMAAHGTVHGADLEH
jgi:hypothetical protein